MEGDKAPMTQAIRTLRAGKVSYRLCPYPYEDKGGTRVAARCLGVDEHRVVKTLVMVDERQSPFVVLMHGDREVSTRAMARHLGVKGVKPCDPRTAERLTGYQVGGISPFGTRRPLRVYMESTLLDLPSLLINAGRRGLLAELSPEAIKNLLQAETVTVATNTADP